MPSPPCQTGGGFNAPTFFLISSLSARLTGDVLTFYRSLTDAQKLDYNELTRLFRLQYKTNEDVLKAQVETIPQQPGQDVSTFYQTLRDLGVPCGSCTQRNDSNYLFRLSK